MIRCKDLLALEMSYRDKGTLNVKGGELLSAKAAQRSGLNLAPLFRPWDHVASPYGVPCHQVLNAGVTLQ